MHITDHVISPKHSFYHLNKIVSMSKTKGFTQQIVTVLFTSGEITLIWWKKTLMTSQSDSDASGESSKRTCQWEVC